MSLLTNLQAYWKLDESSGNPADATGNGKTLTNNNSVAFDAGLINNGGDFGSSNSTKGFSISDNLGIDGGAISFSLWIKPTALPGSNSDPFATSTFCFASQGSSTSSVFYSVHLANVSGTNRVYFARYKNDVASTGAFFNTSVSTSSFTHVVGTYDGTNLQVYVNNSAGTGATDSGNGSAGSTFAALGSRNSVAYASGKVDEVGIWSRALTVGEISSLYNSGAGYAYPFVTYTRTLSDSVSSGAGRAATVARIAGYSKALSDSVINGASRLATVAKGTTRALSVSMMNAAGRLAMLFSPTHWSNVAKSATSVFTNLGKQ